MSAPRVVKRTPDLGVKIRLQRPVEQAKALEASIDAVQWLGGFWPGSRTAPDENAAIVPADGYDDDERAVKITIREWEGPRDTYLIGVPVGDVVFGVEWTWAFSEKPQRGFSVEQRGQFLYVIYDPFALFGVADFVMTATATGPNGEVAGTLTLEKSYDHFGDY